MSVDPLDVPVQLAADDTTTTLREVAGGQPTLVVLTRHLDCPYCEVHVGAVVRERDHVGRVVLVAHGEREELASHYEDLPAEFVLVADTDQSLYDAFGTIRLTRARDLRVSARNLWTVGLGHLLRGRRLRRPGQDLLQLGGDAVIDAEGRIALLHRAERADDRLPVAQLAQHMHRAA